MCGDRRSASGQALTELLVALVALVPLLFGVVWLGKVIDARHATIAAARALAFECTVRIEACASADAHPELAAETRRRFFSDPRFGLRTDDAAEGAVTRADRHPFWTDRRGAPLLERYEDVSVAVRELRFDSPLSFAGGQGSAMVPGALRLLSELGGPGRFGLALDGGLVEAQVRATLSRSRPADGWTARLLSMPLTIQARLAVLTDAWNASGPYGDAPDTVETRVEAGARVPAADPLIEAGWLGARALLGTASLLRLEPAADALRWREIDVDLVPPDRTGDGVAGPESGALPPTDRP
ncbi:MAG: hypothetical protein RJA99_602 [Pseudomonadota bacterium]|jgi:hypothetical protein